MKKPDGCTWPEPDMEQTELFPGAEATALLGPEVTGIPIENLNDVKILHELVQNLWMLLDDIDTVGDMAKENNVAYRSLVEMIQVKRHNTGIKSDGYNLFYDKQ